MANPAFREITNEIVGGVRGRLAQAGYNHDIGTLAALVAVQAMIHAEEDHLDSMIELDAWNWYDEKTVAAHVKRDINDALRKFLGEANGDA